MNINKVTAIQALVQESKDLIPFRIQFVWMLIKNKTKPNDLKAIENNSKLIAYIYKILKDQPQIFSSLYLSEKQNSWKNEDIVQFFSTIQDEPFISFSKILQQGTTDSFLYQTSLKIKEVVSKQNIKYQKIIQQCNNQIALLFWISAFKFENIVHQIVFLSFFMPFLNQINLFKGIYSESQILKIIDPNHKCFVSPYQCKVLFRFLTNSILSLKAEKKSQKQYFFDRFVQNKGKLQLKFEDEQKKIEIIQIGFENYKINKVAKQNKFKGTFRAGISEDNELVFKSKFLSRKQFAINYEQNGDYSLVCLSRNVFTSISESEITPLILGAIFYKNNSLIQILSIEEMQQSGCYEDITLESVPQKSHYIQTVTYEYISGELKGAGGKFNKLSLTNDPLDQSIVLFEDKFYFKAGVRILLKRANDILKRRIGRKCTLRSGMSIYCDELRLDVL